VYEVGSKALDQLKIFGIKKAAGNAAFFIHAKNLKIVFYSSSNCAGLDFIITNFPKILILKRTRDFFGEIIGKAKAHH